MKKEDIKIGDKLLVKESILLNNYSNYIEKGTILRVYDFTTKSKYILCSNESGTQYILEDNDLPKLAPYHAPVVDEFIKSKYGVGCILAFNIDFKVEVYRDKESKDKISVQLPKGTQIVIRSIKPLYYKCTLIDGEYKGLDISILQEILEHTTTQVGDIIDGNFGDYAKQDNNKPVKQHKDNFKINDEVVYYKSYLKIPKDNMPKLGTKLNFMAYLNCPLYYKGIPLDCMVTNEDGKVMLANSNCLKLYKANYSQVKHKITVTVKGNRIRYIDRVGNDFVAGMSVCDNQDKFNMRTGLLLAIARAYNDKALEDFALDKFKD